MSQRLKLRVIGLSEVLPKRVLEQAAADLPFDLEFVLIDGVRGLQRVVTRPESFDIYHQWHTIDLIWTARAVQTIDLRKIKHGNQIRGQAQSRQGDSRAIGSVYNKLFVQPSGRLGAAPTNEVAMLPLLHGVDAFGYLPSALSEWPAGTPNSWGWLLDPRLHGRVAMMSDPVLGMIEASLAAEAAENEIWRYFQPYNRGSDAVSIFYFTKKKSVTSKQSGKIIGKLHVVYGAAWYSSQCFRRHWRYCVARVFRSAVLSLKKVIEAGMWICAFPPPPKESNWTLPMPI